MKLMFLEACELFFQINIICCLITPLSRNTLQCDIVTCMLFTCLILDDLLIIGEA